MSMRCISFIVAIVAASDSSAADDTARDTLTRARLEADVGHLTEAIGLVTPLADDADLSRDVRCEAMVRRGAWLVQDGKRSDGFAVYRAVDESCGDEIEAMRLLTEVITGVQQRPLFWRGQASRVRLQWDPVAGPAEPIPRIVYSDRTVGTPETEGEEWRPEEFTGDPITISVRDGDVEDMARLFAAVTGLRIELAPELRALTSTMEIVDVPWDQAFVLWLDSLGLRAIQVDGGLRIERRTEGAGPAAIERRLPDDPSPMKPR